MQIRARSEPANHSRVAHARSLLFVPATKPDRIHKALNCGTDVIVIDLEDAVAEGSKDDARVQLSQYLSQIERPQLARTIVRVNAIGTPWHTADITLLRMWVAQGVAVMLPKADGANVHHVARMLDTPGIVALIESLAGLDTLDAIARVPQIVRLAFGHLDFQLDLGMHASPDEPELAFARNAMVAASRRARLPAPIDGVTVDIRDDVRLLIDTQRARAFGFGGKLCIHPAQIACVNTALGDSEEEQAWARRVLHEAKTHSGAAFSLDGRMVDLPVIRAAEAIVARAHP